jgi:hypothetical protein
MLVPGVQRSADIGSVVGGGAIEYSRAEGVSIKVEPRSGHETVSGRSVVENGYVSNKPALETNNKSWSTYRKRSHSPEVVSRLVGTSRDSPTQEPLAKGRRLSEEEQPPCQCRLENESAVGTADSERDGQASVKPLEWESKCIGILATEV